MHRSYGLQGSLKRRYKHPSPTSINGYHTAKKLLSQSPAKRPTFAFADESGYTLGFAQRIAHNGLHAETGAVSDGGAITTLGAFHTFRKPCVARCQNGKLCRFWVLVGGTPEGHREPTEQRCAYARRCSAGVAAPLGCVIFSVSVEIAACTPSALREKSRTRAHTPKQVAFWVGALSLPSTRAARSRTSPGRVSERRTVPLWDLGREVLSKNAESLRDSDALMRVAVPRRRGPAGLRDLFRFCRSCGLYTLRSELSVRARQG